jgi:hypothetical protein
MAVTLAVGISASDQNAVLSDPVDAVPGDMFRIGDEVVQFSGYGKVGRLPDHSRTRVIFQRGKAKTAAVSHSSGTAVNGVADVLATVDLT